MRAAEEAAQMSAGFEEYKKAASAEGMRFLRDSAVDCVLRGVTTLHEINKVTFVE